MVEMIGEQVNHASEQSKILSEQHNLYKEVFKEKIDCSIAIFFFTQCCPYTGRTWTVVGSIIND